MTDAEKRISEALDGGDFGPMLAPAVEKVLAHVEAQAAKIARLTAALSTCVWALRQPLDGWKGECERKALDKARDALKEQR